MTSMMFAKFYFLKLKQLIAVKEIFTFKSKAAVNFKQTGLWDPGLWDPGWTRSLTFSPSIMEIVVFATQAYGSDQKREL